MTELSELIAPERTAIFRERLSTPLQALLKHGFLNGSHSVFDFGCGRGDDLRMLELGGIEAHGWDPYYAPEEPVVSADVVNLGFVINVIENPNEREDVLRRAFKLANQVLAVSVMLEGQARYETVISHRDGVITARDTFQKYYTQAEVREFLEKVLRRQPIAVRPGCFFVFKNDADEQEFLEARQHHRIEPYELLKWSLPADKDQRIYERNKEVLDEFWRICLELGRLPAADEFSRLDDLKETVGGIRRAFSVLSAPDRIEALEKSAINRKDDLLAFLALNLFEDRRSASVSTKRIERDIKAFLGGRRRAQEDAREALMSLGQGDALSEACVAADDDSLGWFNPPRFFFFEIDRLNRLPLPIRLYVGCASQLYGGLDDHHLLKVHIDTAKLTAMRFDDYRGKKIPLLLERIKIDMRSLDVWFYTYDGVEFPPQPLYFKSRYMSPFEPGFDEQYAFDEIVSKIPGVDDHGDYGPPLVAFSSMCERAGYRWDGDNLQKL